MHQKRNPTAFTLIEGLAVLAVLAILLAIVLPIAMRNHRKRLSDECANRRFRVQVAVTNWENRDYAERQAVPTWEDLVPAYLEEELQCPTGAEYILESSHTAIRCSSGLPGHD